MIEHFVELVHDDMDIETVAEVAYESDPNPTGLVTRGELSSEVAQAMQYPIYAMQDAEAKIEALEELAKGQAAMLGELMLQNKQLAAQNKRLEDVSKMQDQKIGQAMNIMRVLYERGVIPEDAF